MIRSLATVITMLALAQSGARAAHPLITEDTGTQGSGRWQLEANAERTRDRVEGSTTRGTQAAMTLSYGAADTLDLQLTTPYARQSTDGVSVSGRLDTSLDVKWRFYEEGPLSFALKPGLTLPTGRDERGLGSGRATWGSFLIFTYERERWAVYSHVAYRRNRNRVAQRQSLNHASAAFALKPIEGLKIVLDHSVDTHTDAASGGTLRQTVLGFIYSITPSFDVDAGFRRGNDPAIDRALLLGVTARW